MKKNLWILSALIILAVTFTGCTVETKRPVPNTSLSTSTLTQNTNVSTSQVPGFGSVVDFEATIESIYARTNPSLVNIRVLLPATDTSVSGAASGSGFIWDTNGNIVTNNHVVEGATRITVNFSDGTTVDGSLVGYDADSDLAVIKVKTNGLQLQPVTMADSTKLKVGQLAIAIGNPFGLQGTMTVGFISSLGRLIPTSESTIGPSYSIPDVIQTDAAINPGNSGGLLLDSTGNVIGVTSSIATTSGTSAGVGFAIPSAIVKQVVPALIKTGRYDHPYLGVAIASLNPDLATAMNLSADQRGALVKTVTSGGPASKAGLQGSTTQVTINNQPTTVGGDVIIAYNGQTVKSSDDLITFLARSGTVGQAITFTVLRDGKQIQVQVVLGARPSSQ